MEGTIGEIRLFAGNFAPRTWAFCSGQILPIAQNTALFSILGTTYGGNGTTTFALPDLRGRVPVGVGSGPGLPSIALGEVAGVPSTNISIGNMPAHNHVATSTLTLKASNGAADAHLPVAGKSIAAAKDINTDNVSIYGSGTPNVDLNSGSGTVATQVGLSGQSLPLDIRNPYLGLYYVICLNGIFPSRD